MVFFTQTLTSACFVINIFYLIQSSQGITCHQCLTRDPVTEQRFCTIPKNHKILPCGNQNEVCFSYMYHDIRSSVTGAQYGCFPSEDYTALQPNLDTEGCLSVEIVNPELNNIDAGEAFVCFCETDACNRLSITNRGRQRNIGEKGNGAQRSWHRQQFLCVIIITAFFIVID